MTAFFITSSGTEIGKTFVACELAKALRGRQRHVHLLKPVISGFDPEEIEESDSFHLLKSIGVPPTLANITAISPWQFKAPLSPDMAASREGRRISLSELKRFCQEQISQSQDFVFVEGVGGVMVPLNESTTVLDWISVLGLPAIVVVGGYLGTISHTLTTVAALASRDIEVPYVIVNESEENPVPIAETAATIKRFVPTSHVLTMSRTPDNQMSEQELMLLIDSLDK
jgi:dethiobiotin synthetase